MKLNVLGIDTSASMCSVAVLRSEQLAAVETLHRPRAHARYLAPMIQSALARSECTVSDLDLIAVAAGPGSYTGLRIGVSTAKGLAWAADTRLVGVSSLEIQVQAVRPLLARGDYLLATLPSRRGELYAALFRLADSGKLETCRPPASVKLAELAEVLDLPSAASLLVVGEAADLAAHTFQTTGLPARAIPPHTFTHDARWVALLGLDAFRSGRSDDIATFEPAYLNPFVAKPGRPIFERLPDMATPDSP